MTSAKKRVGVYLHDILDAIQRIEAYAATGEEQFFASTLLQDAVIRQLSIIGEASAKLPKTLRATQEHIPWADIVGMRNIIIHDYSETDIPTVWHTVQTDLPMLQTAVESMLTDISRRNVA
ncbi:MAG TPA: DUF86 domain-containing protein [Pirellulales bacterium]|nr:DUF86 domain-containing protein [Pirellulales bacterium]